MSLRRLIPTLIVLAAMVMVALLYWGSNHFLLRGYEQVEHKLMLTNLQRLQNSISSELDSMRVLAKDWAFWDDSYQFMESGDPAFIESNLVDTSFIELRLNLILFLDPEGKPRFAAAFDRKQKQRIALPSGLEDFTRPGGALLTLGDTSSARQGFIALPDGILMVAAAPILTSNNEGPARGCLVMGRFMNETEWSRISERIQLPLRTTGAAAADMEHSPKVEILSEHKISGQMSLTDLKGQPLLNLQLEGDRTVMQMGRDSLSYFVTTLVVISALNALLIWFLIRRLIVTPLLRLSSDTRRITTTGEQSERVSVQGPHELRGLQSDINTMLGVLEHARQRLLEEGQHLSHLAHHDALTGLPNRLLLDARLNHAVQQSQRNSDRIAVLFLDLDRFKPINDNLGHPVGDKLLQQVAVRLSSLLRQEDTVARLGGDEFTLVLEHLSHVELATSLARKVLFALAEPFLVEGHKLSISASIGIALFPDDANSATLLLQCADLAMYKAKESGRNAFAFYSSDLTYRVRPEERSA